MRFEKTAPPTSVSAPLPPPGGASTAQLPPAGHQPFCVHQNSTTFPAHKATVAAPPAPCDSATFLTMPGGRGRESLNGPIPPPPLDCIHIYHPSLGHQPMTQQLSHKETQLRSCDLRDSRLTIDSASNTCAPSVTSLCFLLDLKTYLGTTHLLVLSQKPGSCQLLSLLPPWR